MLDLVEIALKKADYAPASAPRCAELILILCPSGLPSSSTCDADEARDQPGENRRVVSSTSDWTVLCQQPTENGSSPRFMPTPRRKSSSSHSKLAVHDSHPTTLLSQLSLDLTIGLGLNVTCASRVYLLDPWWNPSAEEQAIDRVHRIGQKRPVHVKKFVIRVTLSPGTSPTTPHAHAEKSKPFGPRNYWMSCAWVSDLWNFSLLGFGGGEDLAAAREEGLACRGRACPGR